MASIKETIIDLFDLDQMEPVQAAKLTDDLAQMIFQAVLVRVLPTFEDADMSEYEKIVEGNEGGEKLFQFLGEKVPNLSEMIQEEAELLRAELAEKFEKHGI